METQTNSLTDLDLTSTPDNPKHTLLIAELGINMGGNVKVAEDMIIRAQKAGADVVKFQKYDPIRLLGKDSPYLADASMGQFTKPQYEWFKDFSNRSGIEFAVTIFHAEDVDWANTLNMPFFKIASRSVKDTDLLREIAKTGKPVIMSVGMSDDKEIRNATNILQHSKLTLLYCVCKYPTEVQDIKLSDIFRLYVKYKRPVGFSSHCPNIYPAIKAAAIGASVIEQHCTISRDLPGCDMPASLTFEEFEDLTRVVRGLDAVPGQ